MNGRGGPNESSSILAGQPAGPNNVQQGYTDMGDTHGSNTPSVADDTRQLVVEEDAAGGGRSSAPFASFNYMNSIIGSGIIGMPYALRQAGFAAGLFLIFFVAIITDYSLILLIRGGLLSGTDSYQGLVEAAFGKPGFIVLSLIQFIYPFIAMISYNIIIGDTITKVLIRVIGASTAQTLLGNRNFIVAMVTLLITLPLSLYRQMANLAKVSLASLIFIVFIAVAIVIRRFTLNGEIPETPDTWQFSCTGMMEAIGIMTFAFMCHHNSFLLFTSLEAPTQPRWDRVTHWSIGSALILFLVFSISGFTTFTAWTQGDILENYCMSDDLMNVCRLLFSITIMLTFPLECFVSREVIENLFSTSLNIKPHTLHISITVVLVIAAFVISLGTDCLGIVLVLNGVLAAVPLAYILPALCYLRLEPDRFLSKTKIPAALTALFGICVAATGLVLAFTNDNGAAHCSHGKEMEYCTAVDKSILFSNYSIFNRTDTYDILQEETTTTTISPAVWFPETQKP